MYMESNIVTPAHTHTRSHPTPHTRIHTPNTIPHTNTCTPTNVVCKRWKWKVSCRTHLSVRRILWDCWDPRTFWRHRDWSAMWWVRGQGWRWWAKGQGWKVWSKGRGMKGVKEGDRDEWWWENLKSRAFLSRQHGCPGFTRQDSIRSKKNQMASRLAFQNILSTVYPMDYHLCTDSPLSRP